MDLDFSHVSILWVIKITFLFFVRWNSLWNYLFLLSFESIKWITSPTSAAAIGRFSSCQVSFVQLCLVEIYFKKFSTCFFFPFPNSCGFFHFQPLLYPCSLSFQKFFTQVICSFRFFNIFERCYSLFLSFQFSLFWSLCFGSFFVALRFFSIFRQINHEVYFWMSSYFKGSSF